MRKVLLDVSNDEIRRYARQVNLPRFGLEGQLRLKEASVLCVGVGGLGSPMVLYLAAAGVGRIGLIDGDVVDISNLHRQVLYEDRDQGVQKVRRAAERARALNPHIVIEEHCENIHLENAVDVISRYDIVADGTDNFTTRYLINDACVLLGKVNVYASVFQFEGQVSVLCAQNGPCYRCLFPVPPPPGSVPNCAEGGVLGVLPGLMGLLQATEVIKVATGIGSPLVGRLLHYDALSAHMSELTVHKDPTCAICSASPTIRELRIEVDACVLPESMPEDSVLSVSPRELEAELRSENVPQLLDVREPHELQISVLPGVVHIPMGQVPSRVSELDPRRRVVVICRSGNRSHDVAAWLVSQGFANVRNLETGMNGWANDVDRTMAQY